MGGAANRDNGSVGGPAKNVTYVDLIFKCGRNSFYNNRLDLSGKELCNEPN